MLHDAAQLYFRLGALLFDASIIGSGALLCVLLLCAILAYMYYSPLSRTEYIFTISIPVGWVFASYVAVVAGLNFNFVVLGFWLYVMYAIGLALRFRYLWPFVVIWSSAVLIIELLAGFVAIAMTGQL